MKRPTQILILGLAVFLATGRSWADPARLPDLVKQIHPAVVTVITYGVDRNVQGIGSGFFVDDTGEIITNYHVMKGAYAAEVRTAQGARYPVRSIVAESEETDLVKIRVEIPARDVTWVTVVGTLPEIAEQVVVVGSPMGLEQTVSAGIVSAVRDIPGVGKFFQISAPISRGSSGSPVVNMDGRVIGVVSFMVSSGQNLNFAVSGENILLLKDHVPELSISQWAYGVGLKAPSMAEALCRDGFRHSMDGAYDKALEFYREAAEKDPEDTRAWYGLSSCYVGLGHPEKATDTLKKAISANPKDSRLQLNLGNHYVKMGRFDDALVSFQNVIRMNPEEATAYHLMGAAQAELGMFSQAIASQKKGILIESDNPKAHYNLGVTLAAAGRLEEAIIAYEHAVQLRPDFLEAHNNMGILYAHLDRAKEAARAHQQVIRIQPDSAQAHYNLGIAYVILGDKALALDEYGILKRLDPVMARTLFDAIYN